MIIGETIGVIVASVRFWYMVDIVLETHFDSAATKVMFGKYRKISLSQHIIEDLSGKNQSFISHSLYFSIFTPPLTDKSSP